MATYRREVEKAVIAILAKYGFKDQDRNHILFVRQNEITTNELIVGFTSYGRKSYFSLYLSIVITFEPIRKLFATLTNQFQILDPNQTNFFLTTLNEYTSDVRFIFTGERSMEENCKEFEEKLQKYIFPFFDRYNNLDLYYADLKDGKCQTKFLDLPFFNLPILHFMHHDYKNAMKAAKDYEKEIRRRNVERGNHLIEAEDYAVFVKNLETLISKTKKTKTAKISNVLKRIFSRLG